MHDPTKQLLGVTNSSAKDVSNFDADPATYKAGLAVRMNNAGSLALALASGMWAGISLGKSLDSTKKTCVARTGESVPVLLTDDEASYAYVVKGQPVYIDDVTGLANDDAAEDVNVSGAIYVSGVLDGIAEDGTIVKVALVDMPGGL